MFFGERICILKCNCQLYKKRNSANWRVIGMGLFGAKKIAAIDVLLESLELNRTNNYKDAARDNFNDICSLFDQAKASGKYPDKTLEHYGEVIAKYAPMMEGMTHQNNVRHY